MLTDGLFTLRKFRINCKNNEQYTLIPFGDVHRDSQAFADDKWEDFLNRGKKAKNALYIGMGDYMDSWSTSERVILGNDNLHETTKRNFETEARKKIETFAKEISFMKGKLLGLLGGNHFVQFSDGTTGDQYLANIMGCQYLGACSAVRVTFAHNGSDNHCSCVDIFAHHGKGAGATTTGRMSAPEKMAQICEADIFLQGHNHARGVLPMGDKLRIEENNGSMSLRSRHCWIGRTGGFLRGYVNNQTSYITDGAMSPTSIGWIEFTLTPKRIRTGGTDRVTVEIGAIQ